MSGCFSPLFCILENRSLRNLLNIPFLLQYGRLFIPNSQNQASTHLPDTLERRPSELLGEKSKTRCLIEVIFFISRCLTESYFLSSI